MEQLRVDPSDWANRRQNAMNRARELRSRLKERENNQAVSTSREAAPTSSKAELQRLRRSRQLEETQRLLDGYVLNNLENSGNDALAAQNKSRHKRIEEDDDFDTHDIVSREQLDRIRDKYQHLDKRGDAKSRPEEVAALSEEGAVTANRMFVDPPMPETITSSTLREHPLEGRGRGRGRGRNNTGAAGSFGELSQLSRVRNEGKSPRIAESALSSHAVQSYLRDRQVPSYREGECDKLAILRKKLVARREKQYKQTNDNDEENNGLRQPMSSGLKSTTRSASTSRQNQDGEMTSNRALNLGDLQNLSINDNTSIPSSHSVGRSSSSSSAIRMNHTADLEDEKSVVEIKLIECDCCKRSFAPKVYEKHFDRDGQPKCANQMSKKRAVFNSAKARITNNDNLNRDEQMQVIQSQKQVAKELAKKKKNGSSSRKKKHSKWQEQSTALREAMKANRLIAKAEREGKPAHYYL